MAASGYSVDGGPHCHLSRIEGFDKDDVNGDLTQESKSVGQTESTLETKLSTEHKNIHGIDMLNNHGTSDSTVDNDIAASDMERALISSGCDVTCMSKYVEDEVAIVTEARCSDDDDDKSVGEICEASGILDPIASTSEDSGLVLQDYLLLLDLEADLPPVVIQDQPSSKERKMNILDCEEKKPCLIGDHPGNALHIHPNSENEALPRKHPCWLPASYRHDRSIGYSHFTQSPPKNCCISQLGGATSIHCPNRDGLSTTVSFSSSCPKMSSSISSSSFKLNQIYLPSPHSSLPTYTPNDAFAFDGEISSVPMGKILDGDKSEVNVDINDSPPVVVPMGEVSSGGNSGEMSVEESCPGMMLNEDISVGEVPTGQTGEEEVVGKEDRCSEEQLNVPWEDESNLLQSFDNLPVEVIQKIFSYLSQSDLCMRVTLVCRRWYELALDPIHWQTLTLPNSPKLTPANFFCLINRTPLLKSLNLMYRDALLIEELQHMALKCPLLVDLDLGFCDAINESYIAVLGIAMPRLLKLNLEGCVGVNSKCVGPLCQLRNLRDLNLSHCDRLESLDVEMIAGSLDQIEHFNVDGIPDVKHSAIATLCTVAEQRLLSLQVDGAELDDETIAMMSHCGQLERLSISFADLLTDTCLGFIQTLTHLTSLTIKKGMNLSSGAICEMFKAKTLGCLTHLSLAECSRLEDDAVFAIIDCCGSRLTHLHLCWCWNVSDVGLEAIVKNCRNLETLDILGINLVKGDCLADIPRCLPHLRLLDLTQCNKIKDDIVAKVVKEFPQLKARNYYGDNFPN